MRVAGLPSWIVVEESASGRNTDARHRLPGRCDEFWETCYERLLRCGQPHWQYRPPIKFGRSERREPIKPDAGRNTLSAGSRRLRRRDRFPRAHRFVLALTCAHPRRLASPAFPCPRAPRRSSESRQRNVDRVASTRKWLPENLRERSPAKAIISPASALRP